jgi:diguanylate cyclase (GGDEF)-like protein/PAS domain S-box-containing protein
MTEDAPGASATPSSALVLVVDDNDGKRLAITAILEPLGHTIVEAASGEAALRAVMERSFAVVLMDVNMPGMDGYETARLIRLRRECAQTPIIFITANAPDETDVPVGYESGAVDFIFSPIVPETLRAKVSIFAELFRKSCELERSLSEVTRLSNNFRDSESRTRAVLDNVADGIVTVSDEGVIETFNRAARALFGYSEQEALGRPFSNMVASLYGGEGAIHRRLNQAHLSQLEGPKGNDESIGRRKDGSTFPMELALSAVDLGSRRIHIGCLRDISERQTYTDSLRHQVLHDDLTGLPNRVLFEDRVNHAIRAAARRSDPLALLVMDLNEFKRVNDTLGHQSGDLLLKLVAQRLTDSLREEDTVARLGGDEFGILLAAGTDLFSAQAVAWKISQALEPTFTLDHRNIDVRASIGITLIPDHGDNIDDLLRRADLAMYDAKRSGGGCAVFAASQEETPARRIALLSDLRQCIANQELVLHYQPKIDLATQMTVGVEALIRWNHPSGTLLMPDTFMPEIERSEMMIPVTEWVVNEALRTQRTWRDAGYELTMAVNLGARCLGQGSIVFDAIESLTKDYRMPPGDVTLELTENALIDTALPGLWERLQAMGQKFSIDDFGTGYSSLAYLQRFPVREIKADKSFVMTMSTIDEDSVIVRSIIELAHNLSLQVVAEGVEDEATMNLLMTFGCDAAQGYHFSRPLPAEDLLRWLETSPFGSPRRQGIASPIGVVAPSKMSA